MSVSADKFEGILELLRDHCIRGYLHFRIWRRINDAFRDMPDQLRQFGLHMKMSWEAHDEIALLYLIRLLDRDSKSVGIHYLLRVARSNPHLFDHAQKQQLFDTVEKDQALLDGKLSDKLIRLKDHRDTHVAHSDKSLLSGNVELVPSRPLTRTDIEELYRAAIDIVNRYHRFYNDETWVMNDVVGEQATDWLFRFIDLHSNGQCRNTL